MPLMPAGNKIQVIHIFVSFVNIFFEKISQTTKYLLILCYKSTY